MKKLATAGLAIATSVLGIAVASGTPAAAGGTNGPLCVLNSNAYMYNVPLGQHVAAVHEGHRFRVHATTSDAYGRSWAYGHSGEDPARDGFILAYHLTC